MRLLGNSLLWALIGILAFPTLAIMITWNAVPGDGLYPLKRKLEDAATLVVSPSYRARYELELRLMDRRLAENKTLISSRISSAGLDELTDQAESAHKLVFARNASYSEKVSAANKLLNSLESANDSLEYQQKQLSVINTYPVLSSRKPETSVGVSQPVGGSEPVPEETVEDVIDEIEEAQDDIEDIIDDIEDEVDELDETEGHESFNSEFDGIEAEASSGSEKLDVRSSSGTDDGMEAFGTVEETEDSSEVENRETDNSVDDLEPKNEVEEVDDK